MKIKEKYPFLKEHGLTGLVISLYPNFDKKLIEFIVHKLLSHTEYFGYYEHLDYFNNKTIEELNKEISILLLTNEN